MSEEILTRWQDPTIAEQQKEIEKLNKCIKDDKENANEIMAEQQQEIERLNNIINELEEYICAIEYDERNYNETWQIAVRIHNKLKELKGGNKE